MVKAYNPAYSLFGKNFGAFVHSSNDSILSHLCHSDSFNFSILLFGKFSTLAKEFVPIVVYNFL